MLQNSPELKNERIGESQCHTKVELKECTFSWVIDHYAVLIRRYDYKLKSSAFSAIGDDFKWHLELSLPSLVAGSTSAALQLRPDSEDDLRKYGPVSGNVKISVLKPDRSELCVIIKSRHFTLKFDGNEKTAQLGIGEMEGRTFQGQLTILCELSYIKNNDIVNVSSPCYLSTIKMSESSLLRDFERLHNDDCFHDLEISVKEKNYLVHKAILAIRSSVFNAMFRNDMQESQKNHINIADIEQETFEEMLHYIYTGKTRNLDELAFELLPVADKYDLKELRIMCENALFEKLSTDNAVKILIFADMHHAEELKKGTLEFIRENYGDCEDLKNADVWNDLTTSRAQLLKDMLDAFCKT